MWKAYAEHCVVLGLKGWVKCVLGGRRYGRRAALRVRLPSIPIGVVLGTGYRVQGSVKKPESDPF